jgi:hypothetical protein
MLEPAFLVAGLSHYKFGHFKPFCVNPPLVRMVAALPVMAAGYEMDWSGFHDTPSARPEFAMGADFIKSNGERSIWLFTIARWACIPFSLVGALFCFFWSRELWGRNEAGLISLILWCFEPNILAHGELITTDCAAASFGLGAAYFFWRWLKNPTWVRAGLAGLLFALAQLSKLSWLFLYGLWPVLWLFWIWNEGRGGRERNTHPRSLFASALQLACILGLGLYLTNLAYGFSGTGTRLGEFQFVSHMLGGKKPGEAGNRFATSALGQIAVPVPSHYLLGFDLQKKDFEDFGQRSYLRGEWKEGGWWYYYLYGLAVKTPHGTQIMLLLATFTIIYACTRKFGDTSSMNGRNLSVLLMPALLVLVLVSSQLEFNHHVRYVLPVLGFAFVIIGAAAFWFSAKPWALHLRRARFPMVSGCQALILVSLLATTTSTLRVYPHQLAYFNELAGGPLSGPRHLLGSNVDWGQGLLALDKLLNVRSDWGPVALLSSGSPDVLGIRVAPERAQAPIASFAGYSHIAVSANVLAGEGQAFRPNGNSSRDAELLTVLRHQQPVDVTDYSILVFETRPLLGRPRQGDLNDAPHGPVKADRAEVAIPATLPSLADARDTKPTISTLTHILLLHGPLDTCSKTLVSGSEALRILTDERRAIAAFGESPFVRTRNGLRYKIDSVLVSEVNGIGESHRDQCLATFAYLGLPPTYPITLQSEASSIQDLVSESVANFSFDQREITWTAIAYAHYLPPARHWTDRFGRTTTFSALLQHLIDGGYSGQSCGGLHVLQAIATIVEADYRSGILDRRTRLVGRSFLQDSLKQAVRSQWEDGSWDLGWFRPNSEEMLRTSNPSPLDSRIVATGHMLQLMHELRNPPRRAIYRATRWLIEVLEKLPKGSKPTNIKICPLTHALVGVQHSCNNRDESWELQDLFATH